MNGQKALFGSAIRGRRSELGMSQEQLSDLSGLNRTYISDIERGTRNPSLESIERLADALQLSIPALFGRPDGGDLRLADILLVEDNAQDVEMTCLAFQKAAIANPVHVVRDGSEALDFLFATGRHRARIHEALPGVVLLDLRLPKIDGVEVLRRIKADDRTKDIPVVVLTTSNRDADVTVCQELGAKAYIVKPVEFEKFGSITPLLKKEWALVDALSDQRRQG